MDCFNCVHCDTTRPYNRSLVRKALWILGVLMVALFVMGVTAWGQDFTIIALPDAQNYMDSSANYLARQTQWIAQNVGSRNIKAVIGLGDIVEGGGEITEWQAADTAMRVLEGNVPYFVVIGNHDYDRNDPIDRTASTVNFNTYFGPSRYSHPYSGYGSSFSSGSNENFYGSVTINGKQYIFLFVEFYPRMSALQWASDVIRSNPNAEIVVVTHGFENYDNTRVALCDAYNAESYGMGADNDGDETWVNLVSQFPNVSVVLSGHIVNGSLPSAAHETEVGFGGKIVNQMLSDFEKLSNGGNGYLRILRFQSSTNRIAVSTYSPVTNTYLTDSANAFSVPWHTASSTGTGTLKGRAKSDGCAPIVGAVVSYGGGSTVSDSTGAFVFTGVPLGVQTVTVQAAGYAAISKRVAVGAGLTSKALFFVSASVGALAGHVTDVSTGAAISNATVVSNEQNTTTDGSGAYTLANVPAVSTQVTVSAPGYAQLTQQMGVTGGATSTLNFRLLPTSSAATGQVSGVITNLATGLGVGGAQISYAHGSTTADASGKYTISVVPTGTAVFTVTAVGMEAETESVGVSGNATAIMNVALTPVASGSVNGTVTDIFTNLPIAWASVSYGGSSTGTNATGNYALTLVPTGAQTITASMSGYQSAATAVSVTTGGSSTANFLLRAASIGTMTGTVTSALSGSPIAGASLAYRGGTATKNAAGVYQFANVPVGSGTLLASAGGYAGSQIAVTVAANLQTTENMALVPDGIVTGTVFDAVTSMALCGAVVSWNGNSVTSSVDGTFTMQNVLPNSQTFTVQMSGYAAWTQTVNVVSGGTVTLSIGLISTGTIQGTVTNASNGGAVSGATTTVAGKTTTSSSTGAFSFSSIPAGTYTLQVTKSGWLSRAVNVTVAAGSTATANVAIATSGILTGTVTTGGVADAGVKVSIQGGVIATSLTLTTNSSGAYKTSWIPVGNYTVTASETGHSSQSKTATLVAGATLTVSFTGF